MNKNSKGLFVTEDFSFEPVESFILVKLFEGSKDFEVLRSVANGIEEVFDRIVKLDL